MSEPTFTIDAETAQGWVRLELTSSQARALIEELSPVIEPTPGRS